MLAPPARRAADRRRQAKARERRRNGVRVYPLPLSDRCIETLIMRFVLSGRLTERQALQPRQINRALADLLEEMGRG
jgi:hypothetical protein